MAEDPKVSLTYSDASMAALPALMLILSDSSALACSERAVTTIDAMQLNDNEPQRSGRSDVLDTSSVASPQGYPVCCRVNLNESISTDNLRKKTQRDFDQDLTLHSSDEQSLEGDVCIPISNMPLHGDSGGYLGTASSTLAHVVAEARDDVSKVWDAFLASLEEPDSINCHGGLLEPMDPSRRLHPSTDFPMPPPKRFYQNIWRSFGRQLFRRSMECNSDAIAH
jgi:hypothetical protein